MRRGSCPEVIQLPPTISVLHDRSRSLSDYLHEESLPSSSSSDPSSASSSDPSSASSSDPVLGHRYDGHQEVDRSFSRALSDPDQNEGSTARHPIKHKVSLGKQFCNFKPTDGTILEDAVLQNGTKCRSSSISSGHGMISGIDSGVGDCCALHDNPERARRYATSDPNITQNFAHQSPSSNVPRKGSEPCWTSSMEPNDGMVGHMKRYSIQINHTLGNVAHRILGDQRRFSKTCSGFNQVRQMIFCYIYL